MKEFNAVIGESLYYNSNGMGIKTTYDIKGNQISVKLDDEELLLTEEKVRQLIDQEKAQKQVNAIKHVWGLLTNNTEDETFIPDTVQVGAVNYDVVTKPFIDIDGERNYQGSCDYLNTQIELVEDMSDERKEDTFFHELTHAIFYEAGFEEQDEDVINRVGKVLHQVIKDNDFENDYVETKDGRI